MSNELIIKEFRGKRTENITLMEGPKNKWTWRKAQVVKWNYKQLHKCRDTISTKNNTYIDWPI